jgi:hypothetical protein
VSFLPCMGLFLGFSAHPHPPAVGRSRRRPGRMIATKPVSDELVLGIPTRPLCSLPEDSRIERCRRANWRRGLRSAETVAARREVRAAIRLLRALMAGV